MEFDLQLEKAAEKIIQEKSKTVLVQLPDGLKPKAKQIVDYLRDNTGAEIYINASSCYGACDIPKVDVDLIIQWGHSEWQ